MNQFKIKYITTRKKQAGVTLLIIIIAMLVIAVLGIAMYTLTFTATLNQVVAQRAARAFYLAESGIRIAASEYKAALLTSTTNADNILTNLHTMTFSIPTNQGQLTINIYPYWFRATAAYPANATSITIYLPGAVPCVDADGTTAITFPATGILKIDDKGRDISHQWGGVNYAFYDNGVTGVTPGAFNAAIGGTPVTFTLSTPFPSPIIAGDEFYVGQSYTVQQNPPNWGGNLILALDPADANDDTAKMFPPQTGTIFDANANQYSYDSRIIAAAALPHTVTLTNIQPVASALLPVLITPAQIYVGKNVGFRSASTYGQ
jgi:hypothetical protein